MGLVCRGIPFLRGADFNRPGTSEFPKRMYFEPGSLDDEQITLRMRGGATFFFEVKGGTGSVYPHAKFFTRVNDIWYWSNMDGQVCADQKVDGVLSRNDALEPDSADWKNGKPENERLFKGSSLITYLFAVCWFKTMVLILLGVWSYRPYWIWSNFVKNFSHWKNGCDVVAGL